eukprot:Nitzschia sp. Nitz4//scaffold70_size99833//13059//14102//NITZ4_004585-RA/size99833-processed-gene-0.3-mRNA-1//1//CDS//3329557105//8901//frame0
MNHAALPGSDASQPAWIRSYLQHSKQSFSNTNSQWATSNTPPYRPNVALRKPQYGKVLYFVHIHKSGGTFFCEYVFRNRVYAHRRRNCNVQGDGYCCGHQDSLEAQIQFANTTFWDLVATERDMYEHMALDYYTYIVSLRRSKDRYYSHWEHLKRMGKQNEGMGDSSWLFANITVDQVPKKTLPQLGNFSQWWAGQPDNWNTRILCGPKCRPQPKYQITRDQFEYTLHRLDQFSFVLFVEDMQGSYDKIAAHYNWTGFEALVNVDHKQLHLNRNKNKKNAEALMVLEPWGPLMSPLDDALYEFAQRKDRGEQDLWRPFSNQEALETYFRDGPKMNYTSICGEECTPY